jgi:hypothetical protein
MIVEQLVEWRLAGETEVLGENLLQRHFVHHKIPHDQTRARTPGRRGGKPATNRLSYGAALGVPTSFAVDRTASHIGMSQRFYSQKNILTCKDPSQWIRNRKDILRNLRLVFQVAVLRSDSVHEVFP